MKSIFRLAVVVLLLAGLAVGVSIRRAAAAVPIYVDDNCNPPSDGSQGDPYCTIQEAVDAAVDGKVISIATGTYNENVVIEIAVTLSGAGVGTTIINGGYAGAVISMPSSTEKDVYIHDLSIRHGQAVTGGGIHAYNVNLTVEDVDFYGNVGGDSGGSGGGGIYVSSFAVVDINRVVFNNNSILNGGGGAIRNRGVLTLTNVTISGNSAEDSGEDGGGIINEVGGMLTMKHVTIANNTGYNTGGVVNESGAYLYYYSTVVADNIGLNTALDNCVNNSGSVTSYGYNIDSQNNCLFGQPTDQIATDPLLGTLAYNGGPTKTHSLGSGSPAIDLIAVGTNDCGTDPLHLDQRSYTRPVDSTLIGTAKCNSGAFEREATEGIISGRMWHDLDADGIQDGGEADFGGVTVELWQGASIYDTDTTAGDGSYSFTVPAGTYYLFFDDPGSWNRSPQDAGGDDSLDSDPDASTGFTINIVLSAGELEDTWDGGLFRYASIGDLVWLDGDFDGTQEFPKEAGLDGVTVELYDHLSRLVDTDVTAGGGYYGFTDLEPGGYYVLFTAPHGYYITLRDQGNDTTDSDADPSTGSTALVTLTSGETEETIDCGMYQKARIGNFVWNDLDQDGIQDAGEPGLAGVTVELWQASKITETTSAGDGSYSFTNLNPGTYHLEFILPVGSWQFSPQDQGGNNATDSDADPVTGITINTFLSSAEQDFNWDCGMYEPSTGSGDTVGTYEPTVARYKLRNTNDYGTPDIKFTFGGTPGYLPISGDWDGDGDDTIGAYNAALGQFKLRNTNSAGPYDIVFTYGGNGSVNLPVAGDWDGDGTDTIGVYVIATGKFKLRNTNDGGPPDHSFVFVGGNLTPLAGDWNGNGTDTIGVYTPANGNFKFRNSNTPGAPDVKFRFGPKAAGWIGCTADWDGDGDDNPGLFLESNAKWRLRYENSWGPYDLLFKFGVDGAGMVPVPGDWDGS